MSKQGPLQAHEGGTVAFRIDARNPSKATVNKLVVRDTPPTGAVALSTSPQATSGGGLAWTRPSLAPGQRWTLTVRMSMPADAHGTINNRVEVTSANAVTVQSKDPVRIPRTAGVTG